MAQIKFLGVHGLGDHRQSPWKRDWEAAVRKAFPARDALDLQFEFVSYDDIFEQVDISAWEATKAVAKLLRSGITGIFGRRARGKGLTSDVGNWIRWRAGYVVAWVEDEEFQKKTRKRFLEALELYRPDVVLAHSLGSLVTYNAITHSDADKPSLRTTLRKLTYVTLGSQLGNAFVSGNLTGGRIRPLDVDRWYHLYNEEDAVFAAPIRLWEADNFQQVETYFDIKGMADHDATQYLGHQATVDMVWAPLAGGAVRRLTPKARAETSFVPLFSPVARRKREPRRRAALIGINEYPEPGDRLAGCVNDVFLLSSILQECGFTPEDIRVCLDQRATAEAIVTRLRWLLDDPQPEDELVFYYSGHGARLPTYGEGDQVDRMDETLVPWDFAWSPETCVTDDQIFSLYSQLPYGTRLVMMFDCCHSGGIHRDGGPRVRGLNPPDDIRHRALRWNPILQMWQDRELERLNPRFSREKDVNAQFFGKDGCTTRLGRASAYRVLSAPAYERKMKTLTPARGGARPYGPYLPIILEACQEEQYAYEYRHGVTSHGAFTYALAATLRREKRVSFNRLVTLVRGQLEFLGYDQKPQVLGPGKVLAGRVPWVKTASSPKKKTGRKKPTRRKR